jgi:outer membrane immunogenic protein
LTGWNAGAGAEWMFMPNWSLKAEAIYWNLGDMNIASTMTAPAPIGSVTGTVTGVGTDTFPVTSQAFSSGSTKVNYQGVIARAGLNYHFLTFGALKEKAASETAPITPEYWTGVYAGLNAGYGFGTNSAAKSTNYGPAKTVFDISGSPVAAANALSMNYGNTQNGFIGGMQFGYNYLVLPRVLIGIETDIQGANIYGSGYGRGTGLYNLSDTIGPATGSLNGAVLGSQAVDAGVNYLGTLRGRVGYMLSPATLVYGTAGFTYGGAFARVTNYAIDTVTGSGSFLDASGDFLHTSTYYGANQQTQLLTGWNAGAGIEWMFMPNWSLKGEAIYWNLGNMNVSTSSIDISPAQSLSILGRTFPVLSNSIAPGQTTVNYQGIIARAGLNYHFSWTKTPIVAKY